MEHLRNLIYPYLFTPSFAHHGNVPFQNLNLNTQVAAQSGLRGFRAFTQLSTGMQHNLESHE